MLKSFKQFISEDDNGDELEIKQNDSTIEDKIVGFGVRTLNLVSQFHVYHWLTKNGTHHEALGKFYGDLQDSIDELIEQAFVKFNLDSIKSNTQTSIDFEYDLEKVKSMLDIYNGEIKTLIDNLQDSDNQHLIEELSDIQESLQTLQYKLQLS
jgi:DNA-binding ferritin-like protein